VAALGRRYLGVYMGGADCSWQHSSINIDINTRPLHMNVFGSAYDLNGIGQYCCLGHGYRPHGNGA
jgi:hypothetical protein